MPCHHPGKAKRASENLDKSPWQPVLEMPKWGWLMSIQGNFAAVCGANLERFQGNVSIIPESQRWGQ